MNKEKFFRPYQAAWDKRHIKQFGTKLTLSQGMRVRAACDRAGVTPYKLMQNLLLRWLQDQENAAACPSSAASHCTTRRKGFTSGCAALALVCSNESAADGGRKERST